jgi:glycosyltransferase involved in cell wall biosynthesis
MYVIFFGGILIVPFLVCKATRKPVIFSLASSARKIYEKNPSLITKFSILIETANYRLADRLVIYSPKLIKEWGLDKYKDKISIAHEHFIDLDKFNIKNKTAERDSLIGYIGRFSEEKGTHNFVQAIGMLARLKPNYKFLVGGDGELRTEIEKYLDTENLKAKTQLTGWIPHDKLAEYLNEIKLLVLPSSTEGLPNMMLEAMACGTLILSTPVGAIPDLIKDGVTGFILENRTSQCIASNAIRVLSYPDLEEVSQKAHDLIEREFTFESALKEYKDILLLMNSKSF